MTKSKNQVALNEENIRKNKRHIFELECQASTSYAESLLLIADIEENRALLSRNFSAAFNGNRAIAVDNIEDLYRCRMLMIDALTAKTDIQQNFKAALGNMRANEACTACHQHTEACARKSRCRLDVVLLAGILRRSHG